MYRLVIRGFELISIAIRAEVVATRKKGPAAKSRWKEFSKNFSAGERPRLWARSPCHVFTLFTRTHRERAYDQSVCYILFSFFYFSVGGGKKKRDERDWHRQHPPNNPTCISSGSLWLVFKKIQQDKRDTRSSRDHNFPLALFFSFLQSLLGSKNFPVGKSTNEVPWCAFITHTRTAWS